MRTSVMILVVLLVASVALILWMAKGVQTTRAFDGSVSTVFDDGEAKTADTSTLTVVVWNVAWGYGAGSEGRAVAKPEEHFDLRLEEMVAVLTPLKPDLVLLQEVDFDATRSHHVNQARTLARGLKLPFVAEAVSWVANWVPFPYWPPSAHFGRMRSGGAILSRYPVEYNEVRLLEKPNSNPFFYNLFYPFRYVQEVGIRWHGAPVTVFNTHLEAFSEENRQAQAERFAEWVMRADRPVVVGGDFNALPPEAEQRALFEDEPGISYESDRTIAIFRSIEGLFDAFPAELMDEDPQRYMTFPSDRPNRKLDHLFHSPEFDVVEARVVHEAKTYSDHLPLLVRLRPARLRGVNP